jgi:hypothetical protein
MPSALYAYIATKTTADFVVPISAPSQAEFNRKIVNAFRGMVGGVLRVGDIKFRSTQTAIDNHLLCDGTTITRAQFPELVTHLASASATEATLPDFSGALSVTAPTVTQTTTDGGTVQTSATAPTDAGQTGGTTGGNVRSGGRLFVEDLR